MNTHADKTQENKNQFVSAASPQMQISGESTFQFVDNRPEAIAQRKLQEMANNSPQAKLAAQLQAKVNNYSSRQQQSIQKKENNTGLPDNLKTGIENLSGYSMDDVKVHLNSDKPTQLQAHAYAQGTDIHIASGQEKHLPHEAWHAVQQMQGRVKPTMQMKGRVNINDDGVLEKEADEMGGKAKKTMTSIKSHQLSSRPSLPVTQRYTDVRKVEYENKYKPSFKILKFKYLDYFVKIQEFLSDILRTEPHLQKLNLSMEETPDLSALLTELMPKWEAQLVRLTDPVPEADFLAMAKEGKIFEDYVDLPTGGKLTHGVQSHRLQWYLIGEEFGQSMSRELYEVSLDPLWKNSATSTLWNLIVDGNSADENDFTQPGKLQHFLDERFQSVNAENWLTKFIQNEQENFAVIQKLLRVKAYERREVGLKPESSSDNDGNHFKGYVDKNKENENDAMWVPTIMELAEPDIETSLGIIGTIQIEKEFNDSAITLR